LRWFDEKGGEGGEVRGREKACTQRWRRRKGRRRREDSGNRGLGIFF
jgi:hypothetical protein